MDILKARYGHAIRLAHQGIREIDFEEWERGIKAAYPGRGISVVHAVEKAITGSLLSRSAFLYGDIVATWGVVPGGGVWLIASHLAETPWVARALHRHWKEELQALRDAAKVPLSCVPLIKNELHIKWLKLLGFRENITSNFSGLIPEGFSLYAEEGANV